MTPCTYRKHQAMKDYGYAKCGDCGESFYAERKPPVVASDVLLADLMAVEEIARVAPELNPSNYDNDDVCRLNTAMCELYEVVRKYRPMANPSIDARQAEQQTKEAR